MQTPKQLDLFTASAHQGAKRKVIYRPPPTDEVDKYVYAVCQEYSEKYGENCTTTEFVQGFRSFVRAIVKARTRQLNRGVVYVPKTL